MKPPKHGTRRYNRIVKKGCKVEKYWTDCGYEYDCSAYDWDCDICPVCIEKNKKREGE